ncbi:MAG: 30S ribosomal protein S4, partial [Candidatus Micrarchaeota archaeon]|nr:30S ribosomal protein S4 [Candidatus Micrarchaeota archaeon]
MARDLAPKYKRSRREGIELHPDLDKAGTAKSPLSRRGYFPGMHGPKGTWTKRSNYGLQLREKQKARRIYGILERQFHRYYVRAIKVTGDTGEVMLSMIERRLDNAVYRLGFAKTRPAARQMVTHGAIRINGRRCNIPSCELKEGDVVEIKPSFAERASVKAGLEAIDRTAPGWLARNGTAATVTGAPDLEDAKATVDMRPIVEFY